MPSSPVVTLLHSPFNVGRDRYEQAVTELSRCTKAELERLTRLHSLDEAWLAVMHGKALSGQSQEAVHRDALFAGKQGVSVELKAQYLRVAFASARCVQRLAELHGKSSQMERIRRDVWSACFGISLLHGALLERVIRDHDVLIVGETGTGKELVARAIAEGLPHHGAGDASPYAEINAAAVPDTLVESELFGHTKGAFTGAGEARTGLVRSANGGSLFLDEVGDLPLSAQAKLLRVIETDQVQPIGSDRPYQVDVRFLAATHRDLAQRVREGSFRADLYQRLAGVVIRIPALRERPEDVAVIGERFVQQALSGVTQVDPGPVLRWLHSAEARKHSWPGNVRELRNVLRNLLLGLPSGLGSTPTFVAPSTLHVPERIGSGEASLSEVEGWYMHKTLERFDGNYAAAARVLGIDRTTLKRKLDRG